MTVQELKEINEALHREAVRIETLTEVVELLNQLLEQHFFPPPTDVMNRTGDFLNATCQGLGEMLKASQLRSQALALHALSSAPSNGGPHA